MSFHLTLTGRPATTKPVIASRVATLFRNDTQGGNVEKDETHIKKNTGRKVPNKRNTANPFDLPVS